MAQYLLEDNGQGKLISSKKCWKGKCVTSKNYEFLLGRSLLFIQTKIKYIHAKIKQIRTVEKNAVGIE